MTRRRPQARQITRLERAIDELIKIQDDGFGNGAIARILDALRAEITARETTYKRKRR